MRIRELFFIFLLVFFSFLFEFVGWLDPLRALSSKYLNSLYELNARVIHQAKQPYDFVVFSFTKSKYMSQMEERYVQALAQLSELDKLRAENTELKKLIENRDLSLEKSIISAPIASLAYPAVSVGSVAGVEENNMVLFNGMLLGTIDKVDLYQSRVSLLSRNRKNKVLAKTESGIEGVIDGDGKDIFLTQIPNNLDLIDGERVVAVGQEGIERNVFIGVLKTMSHNPSAPTQTAKVEQEVSFYDVVFVEVK